MAKKTVATKAKKDRKWLVLLYPDSTDYDCAAVLKQIVDTYNERNSCDYAYITHDEDVWEKEDCDEAHSDRVVGEKKKPHIHVLLRWHNGNPRYKGGLAKELGIDEKWIKPVDRWDDALAYLIHFRDKEKHSYSICEVCATYNTLKRLGEICNFEAQARDDGEVLGDILSYISHHGNDEMIDLISYINFCRQRGYLHVMKKYGYQLDAAIRQHNARVDEVIRFKTAK